MKQAVEKIVKALVGNPDSVEIEEHDDGGKVVKFSVRVAPDDMGRLIGRGTEATEVVDRRLATAREELAASSEFDVTVTGDAKCTITSMGSGTLNCSGGSTGTRSASREAAPAPPKPQPAPPKPRIEPRRAPETFQVLVFRPPGVAEPPVAVQRAKRVQHRRRATIP